MIRLIFLSAGIMLATTASNAGVLSSSDDGITVLNKDRITCTLRQTPDGLVDSCSPTDTSGVTTIANPIRCTLRQTPEGIIDSCAPIDTNDVTTIANPIRCTLSLTPSGIVDVCAPAPDLEIDDRVSIWDAIAKNPTPQVPIACTHRYSPDGESTCLFDDGTRVGASPINNPITCTLRQTPDGLVDSCVPSNGSNQVPAPGGLLLILAALGMAVRKKFAAA